MGKTLVFGLRLIDFWYDDGDNWVDQGLIMHPVMFSVLYTDYLV